MVAATVEVMVVATLVAMAADTAADTAGMVEVTVIKALAVTTLAATGTVMAGAGE